MRPYLFISLLVLASAPVLFAACAADVEESCVGGNCKFDGYVTPPVSGGGGGGGPPMGAAACAAGPTTGDFPCDVFDVLQRRCFACHGDPMALVGPFSIYAYEDTQQPYGIELVFQAMAKAIGPNPAVPMPLGGPPLSAEDAKILGDWLNSCAMPVAEGTGCQCPQPGMGCMP